MGETRRSLVRASPEICRAYETSAARFGGGDTEKSRWCKYTSTRLYFSSAYALYRESFLCMRVILFSFFKIFVCLELPPAVLRKVEVPGRRILHRASHQSADTRGPRLAARYSNRNSSVCLRRWRRRIYLVYTTRITLCSRTTQ